jgi:mono/diheme cytochrome c family protein
MKHWGPIFFVMTAVTMEAVAADDRIDVRRGEELAEHWCADCHAVGRADKKRRHLEVPTFTEIARLPSTTEMSLRAFFQTPHRNMPNLKLTPEEINELVAYILDLK